MEAITTLKVTEIRTRVLFPRFQPHAHVALMQWRCLRTSCGGWVWLHSSACGPPAVVPGQFGKDGLARPWKASQL